MTERNARPIGSTDAAGVEGCFDGSHRALPAEVLMDHEGYTGFATDLHHLHTGLVVGRHRLLADDRHAVPGGQVDERGVDRFVGDDVNEIEFLFLEHLLRVAVHARDVVLSGEPLGLGDGAVVERHQLDAVDLEPGRDLECRPEPGAEDREAKVICNHYCQASGKNCVP